MESLSLPMAQLFIQLLGLPGLIFIIWHFDNKRLDKQSAQYKSEQQALRESYEKEHKKDRDMVLSIMGQHKEDSAKILSQYKDDVAKISSLYQNNAHLVGDYNKAMERLEKMTGEMMSVVSLNAQASTHLADAIKNNTFCPHVRELAGKP